MPFVKLGGFFGWERALGAVWAFKEILDMDIEAFCLFDRDYRSTEEIEEFQKRWSIIRLVAASLVEKK